MTTISRTTKALAGVVSLCLLALFSGSARAQTIVLYNGAANTAPAAQGWTFFDGGVPPVVPPGTQTVGGGATAFDTTVSNLTRGGYTLQGSNPTQAFTLNNSIGYTLRFDVQTVVEDHSSSGTADKNGDGIADRAGFSLIAVGSNKKAVELGFWSDQVWIQSDTPLFTHTAESANFNTTAAGQGMAGLIRFDLKVSNGGYQLFADGSPTALLTGALKDYTAFAPNPGDPNPYVIPNLLFLGDDTTSANGKFKLSYVALTVPQAVPEPGVAALLACVAAASLPFLLRKRRRHV